MTERCLITGGAGFIGINLAARYLNRGAQVTILDNFARRGTEDNVRWLQATYDNRVTVLREDLRHPTVALDRAVEDVDVVYHLAAQVAVTLSVTDPREDFEINALGTFNVLEAVRKSKQRPIVMYSSTNKVYGKMSDVEIVERNGRYVYRDLPEGVSESRSLEFYSPYGCSKGTGDQYVLDYARIYGLRTVVFRQSCIYGPHQFGIEDQGWVAWFAIRALQQRGVTIFGDGKQVRDVLFIDDLNAAYEAAVQHIDRTSGNAYNMGGGPRNTLCLLELIEILERHFGRTMPRDFGDWRPGDQLVFVADIQKAKTDFGWEPQVGPETGVVRLATWLAANSQLFPVSA